VNKYTTTHSFTRDRKKLCTSPNRPTPQHAMFLRIYKRRKFLWTQLFDRRSVYNPPV